MSQHRAPSANSYISLVRRGVVEAEHYDLGGHEEALLHLVPPRARSWYSARHYGPAPIGSGRLLLTERIAYYV
jgi:hypothetical protein